MAPLIVWALTAETIVPWLLTAAAAVAAIIAALANRATSKASQANVSTSAFEAVTKAQAAYNLALSAENGALRELLTQCEARCRKDTEDLEIVVTELRAEIRALKSG